MDLAHELKSNGINAVYVHGALPDSERDAPSLLEWVLTRRMLDLCCISPFQKVLKTTCKKLEGHEGMDSLLYVHYFFKNEDRSFHLHNILKLEDKEHLAYKYDLMNQMVRYCSDNTECRHKSSYFEEHAIAYREHCDNCNSSEGHTADFTQISLLILQGLTRLQQTCDGIFNSYVEKP